MYKPPNQPFNKTRWNKLMEKLPKPFIIMSDLNCHHTLWGCGVTHTGGRIINNSLDGFQPIILNDGTPTRITSTHMNSSMIDLTLVSNTIANKCTWTTMSEVGDSDHIPTMCQLNVQKIKSQLHKHLYPSIQN